MYGLHRRLTVGATATSYAVSGLILVMLAAYGVALAALRTLSTRLIVVTIVAANVILMLGPPFQLTDMGNYLGYARLGGLHGMNPYTHVIGQEMHDPIYHFATWDNLHSPYGELFTALSYPLAFLPIPVAYWIVKVVTVLLSLTFIGIVCWCAKRLGRDPRYAAVLVGLNPIYLVYAVGGFHNDFFMLVPLTASIAFLLARRDKSAGAMLVVAVAVKFSAVLLLPFLLVAARPTRRRLQVLYGCVLAGIPLLVMSVLAVRVLDPEPVPAGQPAHPVQLPEPVRLLHRRRRRHVGHPAARRRRARRRRDPAAPPRRRLDHARRLGDVRADREPRLGDAVVRDLAAAAGRARLERAVAARGRSALTVFLVLVFLPSSGKFCNLVNFNPLNGSAGQASSALQAKLSSYSAASSQQMPGDQAVARAESTQIN